MENVSRRFRSRVPTKKLVVSTYLQYIPIAMGALLLLTFVRHLDGVLIRRFESLGGTPRLVAVLGVFLGLTAAHHGRHDGRPSSVGALRDPRSHRPLRDSGRRVRGPRRRHNLRGFALPARDAGLRALGQSPSRRGFALEEARTAVSAGEVREDRPEAGDER